MGGAYMKFNLWDRIYCLNQDVNFVAFSKQHSEPQEDKTEPPLHNGNL